MTLLIQTLEPIRVRVPEGERQLVPGQTYTLPEAQARKLMAKAPGKVFVLSKDQKVDKRPEALACHLNANRPIDRQFPEIQPFIPSGTRILYRSPLFGELTAEVLEDRGILVWCWHPLRLCECAIPRHWIIGRGEAVK